MKTEDILLIEIKYKTLSSKIVWYFKPVFCILFSSVCSLLVGISSSSCLHITVVSQAMPLLALACLLLSDVGCFNSHPIFFIRSKAPMPFNAYVNTHQCRHHTKNLYESIDRLLQRSFDGFSNVSPFP